MADPDQAGDDERGDGRAADAGEDGSAEAVEDGSPESTEEAPPEAAEDGSEATDHDAGEPGTEELRRRVQQEYDFENFGPAEMAEMSVEEWEAAFDDDAWITGRELLDRVEADLRSRIAERDVFAVVERIGGDEPRLVAYSDTSYAIVHPDGGIEGEGTVLQDVKPTVALASMPDYDVPDPPADAGLPAPAAVDDGSSDLGDRSIQLVAGMLVLSSLALFGAAAVANLGNAVVVAVTMGLLFLLVGLGLFLTVANARLSARYRAEEFRDRLRAAGVESGDRPDFLPIEDEAFENPGTGRSEDSSDE